MADRYELVYAPQVRDHLRVIASKHHSLIRKEIEQQLRFEPDVETRNRKPLRQPILDTEWELRLGPRNRFRVFYLVEAEQRRVSILAIGEKQRNRLTIGNEEIEP